ncbi:MAG: MlaE family ABC transporter permease [Methylophagaceae bacterium]
MFIAVGRQIRETIKEILDLFALVYIALKASAGIFNPSHRSLFMSRFKHHLYYAGVKTLYIVMVISVLLGALLVSQLQGITDGKSFVDAYAWLYVIFIVRELAPLICGIILIGRSASAITAEISYLKISNEFDVLRGLGIDPVFIFLVPVFLAFPIVLLLMLIYFDTFSILAGYLMVSLLDPSHNNFVEFVTAIITKISYTEAMVTILKGVIGGFFIGIISIYFGSKAGGRFSDMSKAISNATTTQLIIFFLINVLLSVVAYGG